MDIRIPFPAGRVNRADRQLYLVRKTSSTRAVTAQMATLYATILPYLRKVCKLMALRRFLPDYAFRYRDLRARIHPPQIPPKGYTLWYPDKGFHPLSRLFFIAPTSPTHHKSGAPAQGRRFCCPAG